MGSNTLYATCNIISLKIHRILGKTNCQISQMYRKVCSTFICCRRQRCYHNLHAHYSCCFNVICVLCYQKSQCEAQFTFDTTDSYIFSLSNDMTVIIVLVYMSSISHLYQNPRKNCNWFNCDINWVLTNP